MAGRVLANIETSERNGCVMASFTVHEEDQLMLVTNHGQVIRIRVHGGEGDSIRIAGRKTQGVSFSMSPTTKTRKSFPPA